AVRAQALPNIARGDWRLGRRSWRDTAHLQWVPEGAVLPGGVETADLGRAIGALQRPENQRHTSAAAGKRRLCPGHPTPSEPTRLPSLAVRRDARHPGDGSSRPEEDR